MPPSKPRKRFGTRTKSAPARRAAAWGQDEWWLLVLLTGITVLALQPVLGCDFINYDDDLYVKANPQVQGAFSAANLTWAWTSAEASNWHPLTWLSLMLDTQLFGTEAWGYHLTNLLLHLANTLLLFGLLRRLTGATLRSALVAALFAVHPLHVESVAWVSERKDVLSTLFGLLTLWAYARYAEVPGLRRYLLVVLGLALSLLAKPMLVTLPFVLLLLDYWPLRRWRSAAPAGWLLLEKLPLLVLSVASCVVTVWAQWNGGAFRKLAHLPLPARLSNALVSYVDYLRQTIWPSDLAPHYPHAGAGLPAWRVAGAALLVLAVTGLALWGRRRRPYLLVGWLWYVGTLVPVIGLVQVGVQARADRYTYVPLIGIFLLLSWGLKDLARRWRCQEVLACAAGLALICFMAITWVQALYWQSDITLWNHTLQVTEGNCVAHHNLGNALYDKGDLDGAIACYKKAVELDPEYNLPHYNLGNALRDKGDLDGAIACYQKALELDPTLTLAHNNLGYSLAGKGDLDGAIACYKKALELDPQYAPAHNNLGNALHKKGDLDGAIACFKKALELNPKLAQAWGATGLTLLTQGRYAEARDATRRALALVPSSHPLHWTFAQQLQSCERYLALDGKLPTNPGEALALALMCQQQKKRYAAARLYADAFAAEPQLAADLNRQHRYNAACSAALAAAGQGEDAHLLPDKVVTMFRHWALGWLRDDLRAYTKLAEQNNPAVKQAIQQSLTHWLQDPNLASVRDRPALDRLADNERMAWQALWRGVDELLTRVAKKH